MQTQFRHGDVFLVAAESVPEGAALQPRDAESGDVVLAYGEVTGHAHRIKASTAAVWSADDQRYLVLTEDAALTHEEHARIELPAGCYRVIQQREYSPEEIRRVAD